MTRAQTMAVLKALRLSVAMSAAVALELGCPFVPLVETCITGADCDDGLFCNGMEVCDDGVCLAGSLPCPALDGPQVCVEEIAGCVSYCIDHSGCDDGLFCNGIETCQGGDCVPGYSPCGGEWRPGCPVCVELTDTCVSPCTADEDCDDACFCTTDICDECGRCIYAPTCGDPSVSGLVCNEFNRTCVPADGTGP